jgi:DNA-binding MarR family transcriptional regulator
MKDGLEIRKVCVCSGLRKASQAVTKVYNDHLRPTGLNATQFGIILTVKKLDPITISKLAEELAIDRTTCTRNLKVLQKDSFVRFEGGEDKRVKQVVLTKQGIEVLREATPLWKNAQNHMFNDVGENEMASILKELSRVVSLIAP